MAAACYRPDRGLPHHLHAPSSGGIALIQLLTITANYPVQDWGYKSVESTHLMIEAERRVYADRARHLGDPAIYKVPVAGLLNTTYIKKPDD